MGDLQQSNCVAIINNFSAITRAIFSCFEVSNTPKASSTKKVRTVRGNESPTRNINNNKNIYLSREGEGGFLSDEIIIEILSWLPVKWVLRCKCVCKLWHTIIQDPKFIEKHMLRGKLEMVYGEKSNSNGNTGGFRWLYLSHGLLLETNELNDKYRIRNPATKQVLGLPDPEARCHTMALCFVPSTADYKLVCVHYKNGTTDLGVKVLTVGTYLDWRPLGITLSYDSNTEKTFVRGCKGLVYIVKFCKAESGGTTEIIGLMLEDESSMKINIPDQGFQSGRNKQLTTFTWDDKLSLGFVIQEVLHVWVLENCKKQKWSEKKIIPLAFLKDYPNLREKIYFLNSSSTGHLRVTRDLTHQLSYDTESKKVQHVSTAPLGKEVLYSTQPSLVFLPGMRPEEQIK